MFRATRFLFLTFLPASLLAFSVNAQEAEVEDLNLNNCLAAEGWDETPSASSVKNVVECLVSKIGQLEEEVRPFRNAKGAVVAFDRSERFGACPRGWSLFDTAGGRAIIGAGQHPNGGTKYPAYADNPNTAVGGEETVTLTLNQIPSHRHGLAKLSIADRLTWKDGNTDTNLVYFDVPPHAAADKKQVDYISPANGTTASGGSQPHTNMPPYVALYFCKKD